MAIRAGSFNDQEQRVLVHSSWEGYLRRSRHARGVRLTFCQGSLEIMPISFEHEHLIDVLKLLLTAFFRWHKDAFVGGGHMTIRSRERQMGFEPDGCYWLTHARAMVGLKRWNPRLHPPPDMAFEVSVTRSLIDRLPMYAAFGIPEVWWYHDGRIEILELQDGSYRATSDSRAFPGLRPEVVAQHLALMDTLMDSEIVDRFTAGLAGR